jgi:hypothetical protein
MKNVLRVFLIITLVLGFTVAAHAQATRTWVSGVGDDVNPCSRTAPCKTFQGAISKTAAGGEISVLDPGGFGAVTITKSLTIDGKGQIASILSSGTNGITVNALATDKVYIRNVEINGGGTGLIGVRIINAATVTLENMFIYNMSTAATSHGVSINVTNPIKVAVVNTTIRNVGGMGILSTSTQVSNTGKAKLVASNVRIFDVGQSAIDIKNNSDASITDSTISHNLVGAAIFVEQASATAHVSNSLLSNNNFGVFAGSSGGGTVRLYGCTITQNITDGINVTAPATVSSHQNNAIIGNGGGQAVLPIGQQ